MKKIALCRRIGFALAGVAALASSVEAEPVVGVDVGTALPLAPYRRTVNAGGAIGLWGAYGWELNDWLWAGFILDPQFTFFAADPSFGKKTSSLFTLTGGPRLTARFGDVEGFFNGMGGLYTDLGGPFHDTGGGWNVGGGINYYLAPPTSLGLFARYDQTGLQSYPGSDSDRAFVVTGLTVQHRFLEPAPAPTPVAATAAAPPAPAAPVKQKLVLRGVTFDFDKATLRADARPVLDEAISTFKQHTDVDVSVDGYTDSVGSEAYNLALSKRRADAVAAYLEKGGIAAKRLQVKGFGEANPVASNDTADGRAQNRRVELKIAGE